MEAPEPNDTQGSAVAVVDSLSLRRAGLMAILEPWAGPLGWSLLPMGGEDLAQAAPCRMFIINLGSRPISDPNHFRWIGSLRERSPQVPFVILSDLNEPEEMMGAFGAGASGFIPSSTSPELTFHALTFVAHGGTFFPPSVLLSFGRGTGRDPWSGVVPAPRRPTRLT
jgi:DNA-binding NarL/FixJ family response regulator